MLEICPHFVFFGKCPELETCDYAHGFQNIKIKVYDKPYMWKMCEFKSCSGSCSYLHKNRFVVVHNANQNFCALYKKQYKTTYYLAEFFARYRLSDQEFFAFHSSKTDFPGKVEISDRSILRGKDMSLKDLFSKARKTTFSSGQRRHKESQMSHSNTTQTAQEVHSPALLSSASASPSSISSASSPSYSPPLQPQPLYYTTNHQGQQQVGVMAQTAPQVQYVHYPQYFPLQQYWPTQTQQVPMTTPSQPQTQPQTFGYTMDTVQAASSGTTQQ